jgi:hypothetical protein
LKFLFTAILFLFTFLSFGQEEEVVVDFEPLGGKFDKPTTVTLSATEDATIYYTIDGSRPSSGAMRYRAPIVVKTVNVIRAVAYKNGKRSETVTQSYFCDREYTLPIISIVTNPENLWDYSTGIYVKGCCADTIEPYIGANFWRDWEKHANIEMYETDGELCFNQGVGINLFGGFSRMLPQKSLAIFAREKYGEKRIKYPIFPERDIKKYKSFIIRNSGGDFRRTHFRDAFMTQLAAPTGVAIQAYHPAIVFLNGEYWGIQNLREKISEHYLKSNFGVDKDNVDILRHNGVKRHGSSANYKKLLRFLRTEDMSSDITVAELRTFMDVEDYLRYNIAETYSDNRDAGGNIRYWRERNDSAKWRWVLYDLDLGLGNNAYTGYKRNTVKKFTSPNYEAWPDPAWSTFIIRKLLENETVKNQYINTFADHLNTVYSSETALALIDEIYGNLVTEMPYHVDKWKTTVENWDFHVDVVREFVRERPAYLRRFILQKFDLEGVMDVTIKYPGDEIANVTFNSLKIKEDFEGIYFQDVPVTITVEPKHDYNFIGWEGRDEKTPSITVSSGTDLTLEPLFEPKSRSVQTDSIIFNEIAVYQVEGDTSQDWIEIYNHSSSSVDVSGWKWTKANFKKGFVLPENTIIGADAYLVLARNKSNYAAYYNTDTVAVVGNFEFGLSKKGEHIKLYDLEGLIVDSLTYNYDDWDTAATFNLVHPDSASDIIGNWNLEQPNPGDISRAYKTYLKHEADKKYWTKIYYIGGGSFFFILVVGLLLRRSSKKRKKKEIEL